jgi:hypothetical protein
VVQVSGRGVERWLGETARRRVVEVSWRAVVGETARRRVVQRGGEVGGTRDGEGGIGGLEVCRKKAVICITIFLTLGL